MEWMEQVKVVVVAISSHSLDRFNLGSLLPESPPPFFRPSVRLSVRHKTQNFESKHGLSLILNCCSNFKTEFEIQQW